MYIWQEPTYNLIHTKEQLQEFVTKLSDYVKRNKMIAIDTETDGLSKEIGTNPLLTRILGMSFAFSKYEGYYIPLRHVDEEGKLLKYQLTLKEVADVLGPVLSKGGFYVAHNMKFDYKVLWRSGIHLYPRFWCTHLAITLLNGDSKKPSALKKIISNYVVFPPHKKPSSFEEAAGAGAAKEDPAEFGIYAIDDVLYLFYLYASLKPEIDSTYSQLFYEAELPLIPVLAHMEMKGIEIDEDYFENIKYPIIKGLSKIEKIFHNRFGIEIGSAKQRSTWMMENHPEINLKRSKKTNDVSTDSDSMKIILRTHDKYSELGFFARCVLSFSNLRKALTTYIEKYPKICHEYYDGGDKKKVLHTNFRQIINSGRQSSSPNVQNLTKDNKLISIRRGFKAREGMYLVEGDAASQEYRLIAIASKDPIMLTAYKKDPLGTDFHRMSAQGLFSKEDVTSEERDSGKTFNFSALYKGTKYTISKTLNCSLDDAERYLQNFHERFNGYYQWTLDVEKMVLEQGYTETFFGRKRYSSIPITKDLIKYESWKFDAIVRELLNHIIQGTAGDLLKFSQIKLAKEFATRGLTNMYQINTVHDSIICETTDPELTEKIMKECMEVTIDGVFIPVETKIKRTFAREAA